jgi:hypothetical protein
MTFKFIVNRNPLTVEFETETIPQGVQILSDNQNALGSIFESYRADMAESTPGTDGVKTRRKRNAPDPAAATAPAPAPVPNLHVVKEGEVIPPAPAPAPVPVPVPPAADPNQPPDMPAFLNRTAAPTPPTPPAPAPAPAPATVRLADKVIEELKRRRAASADDGKALADWVASAGIVAKGSTFEETIAVLQFFDDAKVAGIAKALGIS